MKIVFCLVLLWLTSSLCKEVPRIPNKIHQVWVDLHGGPVPSKWDGLTKKWGEKHPSPSWNYTLWGKDTCRSLVAENYRWYLPHFDSIKLAIQLSDVCRYFILHHHGGVYADLDMLPLISFSKVFDEAQAKGREVLILERSKGSQKGSSFYGSFLAIGLMASIEKATFWEEVFKVLRSRTGGSVWYLSTHFRVIHQTGPHVVMGAYWKERNSRSVGLFASEMFYPCDVVCMSEAELEKCNNAAHRAITIGAGKSWNTWFTYLLSFFSCFFPLHFFVLLFIIFAELGIFYGVFFKSSYPPFKPVHSYFLRFLYLISVPSFFSHIFGREYRWLSALLIYGQLVAICTIVKWPSIPSLKKVRFPWERLRKNAMNLSLIALISIFIFITLSFQLQSMHQQEVVALTKGDPLHHLQSSKPKALFLTAHPDDEAMFFLPTITALRERGYQLHLFCLTNGDAYGLSSERERELVEAGKMMGFFPSHVHIGKFRDGFNEKWNLTLAVEEIVKHANRHPFQLILSFDRKGVTGHPNHISVHHAFRKAAVDIVRHNPNVHLYCLDSMDLLTRFLGNLPSIFSHLTYQPKEPHQLVFQRFFPFESLVVMRAHKSQFVWFRQLNVFISTLHYYNILYPLYSPSDRSYEEDFVYVKTAVVQ